MASEDPRASRRASPVLPASLSRVKTNTRESVIVEHRAERRVDSRIAINERRSLELFARVRARDTVVARFAPGSGHYWILTRSRSSSSNFLFALPSVRMTAITTSFLIESRCRHLRGHLAATDFAGTVFGRAPEDRVRIDTATNKRSQRSSPLDWSTSRKISQLRLESFSRNSATTADLRAGHAAAAGPRERDRRCVHQDLVQHANQRDGFHHAGSLLLSDAEEQMEHLQDVGEGGRPVRIRWESLSTEGHLRGCRCAF